MTDQSPEFCDGLVHMFSLNICFVVFLVSTVDSTLYHVSRYQEATTRRERIGHASVFIVYMVAHSFFAVNCMHAKAQYVEDCSASYQREFMDYTLLVLVVYGLKPLLLV